MTFETIPTWNRMTFIKLLRSPPPTSRIELRTAMRRDMRHDPGNRFAPDTEPRSSTRRRELFRNIGDECTHVGEIGMSKATDNEILASALEKNAIIVTP